MTLDDAKTHIQYIKAIKPAIFRELGLTEDILSNEILIAEAAVIATESHWGAINVSEADIFNNALKRLVHEYSNGL